MKNADSTYWTIQNAHPFSIIWEGSWDELSDTCICYTVPCDRGRTRWETIIGYSPAISNLLNRPSASERVMNEGGDDTESGRAFIVSPLALTVNRLTKSNGEMRENRSGLGPSRAREIMANWGGRVLVGAVGDPGGTHAPGHTVGGGPRTLCGSGYITSHYALSESRLRAAPYPVTPAPTHPALRCAPVHSGLAGYASSTQAEWITNTLPLFLISGST